MTEFTPEFLKKWSSILDDMDGECKNLEWILSIELHFNDGSQPAYIDVQELLKTHSAWKLEKIIDDEMKLFGSRLSHTAINLMVDKIGEEVQPITDGVLKNLQLEDEE